MPVHECTLDGKPGYAWGSVGVCYVYEPGDEEARKRAKRKAVLQGYAAEQAGAKEAGNPTMTDVHVPAAARRRGKPLAPVEKMAATGITAASLAELDDDALAELHGQLHAWFLKADGDDRRVVCEAHEHVGAEYARRDTPMPESDPLTLATDVLRKGTRFPYTMPEEVLVAPALVASRAVADRHYLALRGAVPVPARRLWLPIFKAAKLLAERVLLTGEPVLDGFEPLYDLVLKRRPSLAVPILLDEPPDEPIASDFTPDGRGVRFLKADARRRVVLGVVFEPDVIDTQDDVTSAEEIEKACHQFLADYRAGLTRLRLSHDRDLPDEDAVLVENYIAPQPLIIEGQRVKEGAWLQAWRLNSDHLLAAVEDGTLTGFSFGGVGARADDLRHKRAAEEPVKVTEEEVENYHFEPQRDEHGELVALVGTMERTNKRVRIERMGHAVP